MLAKVAGAKRKRQREEEDAEMDVDEDTEMGEGGEDEWMDVDGEEAPQSKKAKTNLGAVVAKGARHPRSNCQLVCMRDEAVSSQPTVYKNALGLTSCWASASIKSSQAAESRSERAQHAYACTRGRERSCYQGQNGK